MHTNRSSRAHAPKLSLPAGEAEALNTHLCGCTASNMSAHVGRLLLRHKTAHRRAELARAVRRARTRPSAPRLLLGRIEQIRTWNRVPAGFRAQAQLSRAPTPRAEEAACGDSATFAVLSLAMHAGRGAVSSRDHPPNRKTGAERGQHQTARNELSTARHGLTERFPYQFASSGR